jgi:hypothetical protein
MGDGAAHKGLAIARWRKETGLEGRKWFEIHFAKKPLKIAGRNP